MGVSRPLRPLACAEYYVSNAQIADGGRVEQPEGGFLNQRTDTPDPEAMVEFSESGR